MKQVTDRLEFNEFTSNLYIIHEHSEIYNLVAQELWDKVDSRINRLCDLINDDELKDIVML